MHLASSPCELTLKKRLAKSEETLARYTAATVGLAAKSEHGP
jgi:hypothetical protein